MINALEEAYLNGIIGDFLGRTEHDGTVWMFSNDEQTIRAMIPRFAAVVLDMIHRDLVEIREPLDGIWDHAAALTEAEVRATLADPDSWVWTEGDAKRMVMLMTTDHANRLIGR